MDTTLGLCRPATTILLVGVAGTLYHIFTGNIAATTSWILFGLLGTGIFQALCFGGLEPAAWILMSIPVLIVCFFLAVALFASRMRIDTVSSCSRTSSGCCNRCQKSPCQCSAAVHRPCGNSQCDGSCSTCMHREVSGLTGCSWCPGAGAAASQDLETTPPTLQE